MLIIKYSVAGYYTLSAKNVVLTGKKSSSFVLVNVRQQFRCTVCNLPMTKIGNPNYS